jgi:hypothetical protein
MITMMCLILLAVLPAPLVGADALVDSGAGVPFGLKTAHAITMSVVTAMQTVAFALRRFNAFREAFPLTGRHFSMDYTLELPIRALVRPVL